MYENRESEPNPAYGWGCLAFLLGILVVGIYLFFLTVRLPESFFGTEVPYEEPPSDTPVS